MRAECLLGPLRRTFPFADKPSGCPKPRTVLEKSHSPEGRWKRLSNTEPGPENNDLDFLRGIDLVRNTRRLGGHFLPSPPMRPKTFMLTLFNRGWWLCWRIKNWHKWQSIPAQYFRWRIERFLPLCSEWIFWPTLYREMALPLCPEVAWRYSALPRTSLWPPMTDTRWTGSCGPGKNSEKYKSRLLAGREYLRFTSPAV